jgi:ABC-type antimicrobial peptide transport system permease subunit
VLRLVIREVLVLSAAGGTMGALVALLLGRYVESRLFEMKGIDPMVTAAAIVVILGVSALAGYLPARRAARIDPLQALRYE